MRQTLVSVKIVQPPSTNIFKSTTTLQCGLHLCPQRCHQLFDHSKIECSYLSNSKCAAGHLQTWQCSKGKPPCAVCKREQDAAERKLKAELERQENYEKEISNHADRMALLDSELEQARNEIACNNASNEMKAAFEQKLRDVEEAKRLAASLQNKTPSQPPNPSPSKSSSPIEPCRSTTATMGVTASATTGVTASATTGVTANATMGVTASAVKDPSSESPSEKEWEQLKRSESRSNEAIDALMKMTGLEEVKKQFLKINSRIDTSRRQNSDLKKERFGIVLLGNPGTGKCCVQPASEGVPTDYLWR
jgi:hypothetical protein